MGQSRGLKKLLSALGHLYVHQIVQRDIKPSNILMCPSDSARVRLIDFGIGRHLGAHVVTRPKKLYDPVAGWWCVVGTLGYRSQNAHDGVELRPRDDLVSVFLALGNLPWCEAAHIRTRCAIAVADAKREFASRLPIPGAPPELSDVMRLSATHPAGFRGLLSELRQSLRSLAKRLDEMEGSPLDWEPASSTTQIPQATALGSDTESSQNTQDSESSSKGSSSGGLPDFNSSSYGGCSTWHNIQHISLTLPHEPTELLDGQIPS